MVNTLDITTEMMRTSPNRIWVLGQNLPPGTYKVTGEGAYSFNGVTQWAYNDGSRNPPTTGMMFHINNSPMLPVWDWFKGQPEAYLPLPEGGTISLQASEDHDIYDRSVSYGLKYVLTFPDEAPIVPPTIGLPPAPVLEACVLPELSWNFIEVVRQAVLYISCNLGNLIVQVSWLVSALAALIPQLLAGIAYFLSLKWITDWIQAFFDRLDIWISAKFGIDPALPFWEELVKKALAWIGGFLDAAAEERMRIRGWK